VRIIVNKVDRGGGVSRSIKQRSITKGRVQQRAKAEGFLFLGLGGGKGRVSLRFFVVGK
jgi:hypothetical protein